MKTIVPAVASLLLAAPAALAHAAFEQPESPQGAAYKAVLQITHGCKGEPTLRVRVQIPEGVIGVKPMPHAGWTVQTITGPYDRGYDQFGKKVTEGVKEIVWTGELPDAFFDEFVFRATLTDAFAVGSTVYFPVVQECANGAERWTDIPMVGQDPHALRGPAPGVKVTGKAHSH